MAWSLRLAGRGVARFVPHGHLDPTRPAQTDQGDDEAEMVAKGLIPCGFVGGIGDGTFAPK